MIIKLRNKNYMRKQVVEEIQSLIILFGLSLSTYFLLGGGVEDYSVKTISDARTAVIVLLSLGLSVWIIWFLSRYNKRKRLRLGSLEGGYLNISDEGLIIALPNFSLGDRLVYLKSEVSYITALNKNDVCMVRIDTKDKSTGVYKELLLEVEGVSLEKLVNHLKKEGYISYPKVN